MADQREEIDTRQLGGVGFGNVGLVLAKSPDKLLFWSRGSTYWSSRQENYGASQLILITDRNADHYAKCYEYLLDGGRLSIERLESVAAKIDEHFGEGTAKLVIEHHKARTTLVIGEDDNTGNRRLFPSQQKLIREHRAKHPEQYQPVPKMEAGHFTEDQVDRMMDHFEGANDPEIQAIYKKLENMKARFQPRKKMVIDQELIDSTAGRIRL